MNLPGVGGRARRRERSSSADALLRTLVDQAPTADGTAILAVGGYGREQLSPHSDLDIVILHEDHPQIDAFAQAVLYPLWDAGRAIDHSVRTFADVRAVIDTDLKAVLGMLDARCVVGDGELPERVIAHARAEWRRRIARLLPELRALTSQRWQAEGELAYLLEPDLKQARGGLRDVAAMRAIAAGWITDLPHEQVDAAESLLLDVRDALHEVAGRRGDRLAFHHQDAVAEMLDFADADALMGAVAESARSIDLAATLTWRVAERAIAPARRSMLRRRPIAVEPLGDGVGALYGEVVLDAGADIQGDPLLLLRAAATAAERGLALSPTVCARLAGSQEVEWTQEARDLLVRLIASGEGLVAVWEILDHHHVIEEWLPEWAAIRNRPQRNVLHRHTVDRHMVETAVQAAALVRTVQRSDLLLIAALLHDLGKGHPGDHSEAGALVVPGLLQRLGFPAADIEMTTFLVRNHLTLASVATRRDLDDPATIADVLAVVEPYGQPGLQLLHAVTIADGRATGRAGWSEWKAGLVADLVDRISARMAGIAPPPPPTLSADEQEWAGRGEVIVHSVLDGHQAELTVVAPDQRGLLAEVAGVLTLARLDVRAARTLSQGAGAVMRWSVLTERHGDTVDVARLERDIHAALQGTLDVASRVDARFADPIRTHVVAPPVVTLVESGHQWILEVRAHDRPGLLHVLARELRDLGVEITAAIVSTLGAEACDAFYIRPASGAWDPDRIRERLLAVLR